MLDAWEVHSYVIIPSLPNNEHEELMFEFQGFKKINKCFRWTYQISKEKPRDHNM